MFRNDGGKKWGPRSIVRYAVLAWEFGKEKGSLLQSAEGQVEGPGGELGKVLIQIAYKNQFRA